MVMVAGSPSVAVRVYNMDDTNRMEAIGDDDPDGLRNFRDSYEHSMVLFVLPSARQQQDQLGRRESFVNVAQKALLSWPAGGEKEGGKVRSVRFIWRSDSLHRGTCFPHIMSFHQLAQRRTTRTAIVCDISQVIQSINSLVKALAPEKREKRKQYFDHEASKKFLSEEVAK